MFFSLKVCNNPDNLAVESFMLTDFPGELAIFILAFWFSFHCNVHGYQIRVKLSFLKMLKINADEYVMYKR